MSLISDTALSSHRRYLRNELSLDYERVSIYRMQEGVREKLLTDDHFGIVPPVQSVETSRPLIGTSRSASLNDERRARRR